MTEATPATTSAKPTRLRRERPKVVKLTDAAADRIHAIMAQSEGRVIGVRVGVKNGGCAGMSYTMDYAESSAPLDEAQEVLLVLQHASDVVVAGEHPGLQRL